jgi:hypothetical protein
MLGLPEHAKCVDCEEPIARPHKPDYNARWSAAPRVTNPAPPNHNRDGSINRDLTACDKSDRGRHTPKDGSLW